MHLLILFNYCHVLFNVQYNCKQDLRKQELQMAIQKVSNSFYLLKKKSNCENEILLDIVQICQLVLRGS